MLVDNKFFYISLPRCASTSFMATCIKNEINIQHYQDYLNVDNQLSALKRDLSEIDYANFWREMNHGHEPINLLQQKFGNNYDIISVKRNKYDRFVSLWKHILHNTSYSEDKNILKIFKKFDAKDILFYKDYDLSDDVSVNEIVETFKKKYDLKELSEYGKNMLFILIKPYSYWHMNNPNIIWFDFERLHELEEWVSNKLGKEFKLLKINSSKRIESNLILDDEFKELYDSIYYKYDEIKKSKTLI